MTEHVVGLVVGDNVGAAVGLGAGLVVGGIVSPPPPPLPLPLPSCRRVRAVQERHPTHSRMVDVSARNRHPPPMSPDKASISAAQMATNLRWLPSGLSHRTVSPGTNATAGDYDD